MARRTEWHEQVRLAELLATHCDPRTTWWTAHDTVASGKDSGTMRKKRGVRPGLPDTQVIHRGRSVFIEMKSPAGVASASQKQTRIALLLAGARWWLARSAPAAMEALRRSHVPLKQWKKPKLQPWEGPFDSLAQRLPQHPEVAAQRRAARQRWRERQKQNRAEAIAEPPDDQELVGGGGSAGGG